MPNEQEIRRIVREELEGFEMVDRYAIQKRMQVFDGVDIQVGRTQGTKIGTEGGSTGQKIGFWNTTPTVQPSAIGNVAATGSDSDGTARSSINSILAALRAVGIIQT